MNAIKYLLIFFFLTTYSFAQVINNETTTSEQTLEENDTILKEAILLEEVVIHKEKLDTESKKQYLLLQNRVLKVFPYARIASERLMSLNINMSKLKSNREKRKYFKIAENYIENEFTEKLKKLSRKQGQILVKLIHRQTGVTTYDLIKEHKSGWKAFWSNNTARLFDINLKTKYEPYNVNEDYLIETILDRAFESGRLIKQNAANPIDYYELSDYWIQKALSQKKIEK